MNEKTEPKFKLGQIVMMKGEKRSLPFKILEVISIDDEWYYRWNKNNAAAENMLRELTLEEKGN